MNRFEARYTADWQPVELHIEALQGTRVLSLATSFSVTSAINEITQNGVTNAKTDQISARAVVLPNNFYAGYEVLAARPDDPRRGVALVAHVLLRAARDGSTCLPTADVAAGVQAEGYDAVEVALESALEDERVVATEDGLLSLTRYAMAEDAVADTPDEGRLVGRDAVADYLAGFARAFPKIEWEPISQLEAGDTAIDEGYILGTNTGPLVTPDGELPATGRTIRLRECDLLTVKDGLAVSHRFHYDMADMLTQLGLMGADTIVLPGQRSEAKEHAPR